jgi:hypothetical protein
MRQILEKSWNIGGSTSAIYRIWEGPCWLWYHFLVVAKLRERISVSKWARQNFDLERFDLRKLDDVEFKKKYQVEIWNRFAALESLVESYVINNAWESIKENIKASAKDNLRYHNLKNNKPWFDDECSKFIAQRKQAKLKWLKNPSQISEIICKI